MSPKHAKLIDNYWEAVEYGSVDDQYRSGAELEEFELEGVKNGTIKDEDVMLKYVFVFE